MAADAAAVRSVPQSKQPRNPISRKQVESVISRSVAVFGLVFGAQTVPFLLGQLHEAHPLWLYIVVPAMFGSLVVVLVASVVRRWVRAAHILVSVVYLGALISWPFGVATDTVVTRPHWLYFLLTVATATAAIGFRIRLATSFLFLAPIVYLLIRVTPAGGSAKLELAVLETVYAIILGGAVLIIVTMLRQAAAAVDAAQATALDRYGHAVRQHATEVERVEVDSIVHDSVLTTLISAARAFTPEGKELAGRMAGKALGHLREAALASLDDGATVRLSSVSSRIIETAAGMPEPFELRAKGVGSKSIPAHAADAISAAATQAMHNSVQHAGSAGVFRWLEIRGLPPLGIEVVVGDSGAGFTQDAVPEERLGVRVSILDRIANAGGSAVISSAPGEGTTVSIRWPSEVPARDLDSEAELSTAEGRQS